MILKVTTEKHSLKREKVKTLSELIITGKPGKKKRRRKLNDLAKDKGRNRLFIQRETTHAETISTGMNNQTVGKTGGRASEQQHWGKTLSK